MPSPLKEILELDCIELHPPERRQRKKRYVVLYSCCCCCCCCLHTIGGAIGAACSGNFRAGTEPPDEFSKDEFSKDDLIIAARKFGERGGVPWSYPSSQSLYWSSLLLTVPPVMLIWAAFGSPGDATIGILLSIILLGPLWMLAGSAVMALQLALRKNLPAKSQYWRQLRRITVGSILGSLAGAGVMIAIFLLMTGL